MIIEHSASGADPENTFAAVEVGEVFRFKWDLAAIPYKKTAVDRAEPYTPGVETFRTEMEFVEGNLGVIRDQKRN